MLYNIKHEIDAGGCTYAGESIIKATSKNEAIVQWFNDNLKQLLVNNFDGKFGFHPFELEIRKTKIKKAKKLIRQNTPSRRK